MSKISFWILFGKKLSYGYKKNGYIWQGFVLEIDLFLYKIFLQKQWRI